MMVRGEVRTQYQTRLWRRQQNIQDGMGVEYLEEIHTSTLRRRQKRS